MRARWPTSLSRSRTAPLVEIEKRAAAPSVSRRAASVTYVRFFAYTYGEALPEDDGGRRGLLHPRAARRRAERRPCPQHRPLCRTMVPVDGRRSACRARAPRARQALHIGMARRHTWREDGLLDEVRTRLGMTTIAPADVPKEQRDRRRRERANAKRREQTRDEYEAPAKALRAEAAALGISPDALRKRRQRAAVGMSQVRVAKRLHRVTHTSDDGAPRSLRPSQGSARRDMRSIPCPTG